ncbi:MAG TPA: hypothetical protein VEH84_05440 [Alphaproteobacteria bacterium]|nr:hypothetical protein [Alphaproteobacteria bacterium]
MSKRPDPRPPLGGLDDDAALRAHAAKLGLLPTDMTAVPAVPTPPAPTPPAPAIAVPPPVAYPRPAPTKPWQATFPDYLVDQLREAAAKQGTAQKVVVMQALRQAGFQVEDIDLQDLRKR